LPQPSIRYAQCEADVEDLLARMRGVALHPAFEKARADYPSRQCAPTAVLAKIREALRA
jgi:hypothetical protein